MIARKRPNIEVNKLIPNIKREDDVYQAEIPNQHYVHIPPLSKCPPPSPKRILDQDSFHEITSIATILHSLKDRIFQLKNENITLQQDNTQLYLKKNDNAQIVEEQKRSLNRAILQSQAMQSLIEGLSARLGNLSQIKLQINDKRDSIQSLIRDLAEKKKKLVTEKEGILQKNNILLQTIQELEDNAKKEKEKLSLEIKTQKDEKVSLILDNEKQKDEILLRIQESKDLSILIDEKVQSAKDLKFSLEEKEICHQNYMENIKLIIKNLYKKYTSKEKEPPLGDFSIPNSIMESLTNLLEESKVNAEEFLLNYKVEYLLLEEKWKSLSREEEQLKEELHLKKEEGSSLEEEISKKNHRIFQLEERIIEQQRNLSMNMEKISSLQNSHALSLTLKDCLFKGSTNTNKKDDIALFDVMSFEEQELIIKQTFNHQLCKKEILKMKEKIADLIKGNEEIQEKHSKHVEEMNDNEKRMKAQIDTLSDENEDLRQRLIGLKVQNDKGGQQPQQQQQQNQSNDKSLQGLLRVIQQQQQSPQQDETQKLVDDSKSSTSSDLWNVFSTIKKKKQTFKKGSPGAGVGAGARGADFIISPSNTVTATATATTNNQNNSHRPRRKRKINFTP